MTATNPMGRREFLLAAGGLTLLALVQYLPYAFQGGLYTDDYLWLFADKDYGALTNAFSGTYRSLHIAMTTGQVRLLGGDTPWVFLPSVVLVMTQCAALFAVLRALRVGTTLAFTCAALLSAVPWVDATRLWMTLAHEEMAVTVWLAGVWVALTGLRSESRRRRLALGAGSVALYLAAILFYEGVAAPIALSVLVYLVVAPPRRALGRAAFDVAIVSFGLLRIATTGLQRGSDTGLDSMWDRAGELAGAWWELVEFSVPANGLFWGPVGTGILLVAAVGVGRTLADDGRERERVIRAAVMVVVGVVMAAAALAVFLPAEPAYTPHFQGSENRYGVIAGVPTVVMLAGVGILVAIGLSGFVRRPRLAAPLTVLLLGATFAGMAQQERENQDGWIRAATEQDRVIAAIDTAFGGPPPTGSRIFTVRHPNFTNVGAPVFTTTQDLTGEIRRRWGNRNVFAHPYQQPLRCRATRMRFGDESQLPPFLYGSSLFIVDVPTATVLPIDRRSVCRLVSDGLSGQPGLGSPPPWRRL